MITIGKIINKMRITSKVCTLSNGKRKLIIGGKLMASGYTWTRVKTMDDLE